MCRWEGGGWVFSQWGRWEKTSVQTSSRRFLKTLTEGAVTTEAGSLFQHFTTLIENADPLLRWWLAPWITLMGCLLRPCRAGGRKNKFGSIPKRPLNILKAVMRSFRSLRAEVDGLFQIKVEHGCNLSFPPGNDLHFAITSQPKILRKRRHHILLLTVFSHDKLFFAVPQNFDAM